jgi:hypothetical protein
MPDFVVRGGYSLSFLPPDITAAIIASGSTINAAATSITNNSSVPANFMSQGFQSLNNVILQPVGRSNPNFMQTRLNQNLSSPLPTTAYPDMQQWNFAIAKEFGHSMSIQAGYEGTKGTHMPGGPGGLNEIPDSAYTAAGLDNVSTSPYFGKPLTQLTSVTGPTVSVNGKVLTVGQTLRPFPQFTGFTNSVVRSGATRYDALQAQFQKRFQGGESIQASYTWAKSIDNVDASGGGEAKASSISGGGGGAVQDNYNFKAERSLSLYNMPQRLVITYSLQLPFGKGQAFASNVNTATDKLISGWTVHGITTFQDGFPISLSYNGGNPLTQNFGATALRPNYTPGNIAVVNGTSYTCNSKTLPGTPYQRFKNGNDLWFNPACFTFPGNYAFGNEPRVDPVLKSQGLHNFDFTAEKVTKLGERVTTEFKMEFFNLFNSVQFNPPGLAVNGTQYDNIESAGTLPRQIQASLRFSF